MSNLELWHKVEKTDPDHTKPITGKAYKGNSPKPHYIVLKATETFGPCGIGWGFEIVEEKLLDGALLAPGFYERIHMARVRVWYEWSGKRGTVEHVGQTVFSGRRRDGTPFTDEDAPKKSITDGLVKALSMVGFAGDIFLGRYDDSKYVSDLKQEIAEEKREAAKPTTQAPSRPQEASPVEVDTTSDRTLANALKATLARAKTGPDLAKWFKDNQAAIEGLPEDLTDEVRNAYADRLHELRRAA